MAMPNLSEKQTRQINLNVLKRVDPDTEEVLASAKHVVLYDFQEGQWIVILNKKSQGQLAIDACCMVLRLWAGSPQGAAKRAALAALPTGSNLARRAGYWALLQDYMPPSLLMLRARHFEAAPLSPADNFVEDLTDSFKFEISGDYLLYNNKHGKIVGVWFCEQGELQQMDAMLGRIFEMHPSFEASRSGRVGMGASSSAGAAAGAQRQQDASSLSSPLPGSQPWSAQFGSFPAAEGLPGNGFGTPAATPARAAAPQSTQGSTPFGLVGLLGQQPGGGRGGVGGAASTPPQQGTPQHSTPQQGTPTGRDNSLHLLFSNMKYASLVESGSPGAVQTPPPAAPPAVPAAADSQTRPLLLPPAFFQGKTPGGQVRPAAYCLSPPPAASPSDLTTPHSADPSSVASNTAKAVNPSSTQSRALLADTLHLADLIRSTPMAGATSTSADLSTPLAAPTAVPASGQRRALLAAQLPSPSALGSAWGRSLSDASPVGDLLSPAALLSTAGPVALMSKGRPSPPPASSLAATAGARAAAPPHPKATGLPDGVETRGSESIALAAAAAAPSSPPGLATAGSAPAQLGQPGSALSVAAGPAELAAAVSFPAGRMEAPADLTSAISTPADLAAALGASDPPASAFSTPAGHVKSAAWLAAPVDSCKSAKGESAGCWAVTGPQWVPSPGQASHVSSTPSPPSGNPGQPFPEGSTSCLKDTPGGPGSPSQPQQAQRRESSDQFRSLLARASSSTQEAQGQPPPPAAIPGHSKSSASSTCAGPSAAVLANGSHPHGPAPTPQGQGQGQQSGIQAGRTRDSVRAALLSLAQSDAFVDIIVEHLQRQDLKM